MKIFLLCVTLSFPVSASQSLVTAAREVASDRVGAFDFARVHNEPESFIDEPSRVDTRAWIDEWATTRTFLLTGEDVSIDLGIPDDVDRCTVSSRPISEFGVPESQWQHNQVTGLSAAKDWGLILYGPPMPRRAAIGWFRPGYSGIIRRLAESNQCEQMRRAIGDADQVAAVIEQLYEQLGTTSDKELALFALNADPFGFKDDEVDSQDTVQFLWEWVGFCAAQDFHPCKPFLFIETRNYSILMWNRQGRPAEDPNFLLDIYRNDTSEAVFYGYLGFGEENIEDAIDPMVVIEALFERVDGEVE